MVIAMADLKVKRRVLGACQTNCYYVYREGADEIVIIDPGDNGDVVFADAKSLGFEKIAGILLTHGHGDHTGGVLELKQLSGAKVYAYEDEAEILKDPEKNVSQWFGTGYGFEADVYLRDKQTLTMAGVEFEVLHTPGHTKGGCCFYVRSEGVLFSGDTLFANSVGRTDFPGSSTSALIRSIQEKLMTLPDETRVYPGHMGETAIGHERVNNPFL